MSNLIVKVENLSKLYRIGAKEQGYKTLRETIIEGLAAPIRNFKRLRKLTRFNINQLSQSTPPSDTIWALKDVSFEVKQGEVLGIIGRNGAGKSTLLKILSRITEPTSGDAKLYGRVSSLLEIGTGFHPELTGRENIFLNGAVLGMRKSEIRRKFDAIVDFAEIEKFIDTPVKRYSSGMYVRLAFGVASHLEPEILIIDEVLAVGDAEFQNKCLGKMENVAQGGRTVLFVSHNMGAIRQMCSRVLFLDEGSLMFEGDTNDVINCYLSKIYKKKGRKTSFPDNRSKAFQILDIAVVCPDKLHHEPLDINDEIIIEVHSRLRTDMRQSNLALQVKREGIILFNSFDIDLDQNIFRFRKAGDYISRISLPKRLLTAGRYSVFIGTGQTGAQGSIDNHHDAVFFELEETSEDVTYKSHAKGRKAMIIIPLNWNTQRIQ